jgi:molybdopterin synthase catalytic subunit
MSVTGAAIARYRSRALLQDCQPASTLRAASGTLRHLGEHRVGKLAVGDCAVSVGVSAAHRGAAFDACRYVIDETAFDVRPARLGSAAQPV